MSEPPTPPGPPEAPRVPPRPPGYHNRATEEEIRWATFAHLSAVPAMLIGLGFLGPLLVWRRRGRGSPFVRHHVVQAVNFNVTVMLAGSACIVMMALGIRSYQEPAPGEPPDPQWIPATALGGLLLVLIYWCVFIARAAMMAKYGRIYRYPATLPVLR